MTAYVDTSALLKRYIDEPDSPTAEALLLADPVLVTSWITVVEVRRNLARLLDGSDLATRRQDADADLTAMALVNPTPTTWRAAADIAEVLGVRSLDALHLASAQQLQIAGLAFITFDLRQGQAARSMGFHVLGC